MPNSTTLPRSERRRNGYLEKNAQYQKVISSVLGLATVVVGVPLIFFKDIYGIQVHGMRLWDVFVSDGNSIVAVVLTAALVLLFCSIACCLYFYLYSAEYIFGIVKSYDPEEGRVEYKSNMKKMDLLFNGAINAFISGFICMVIFLVAFKVPA